MCLFAQCLCTGTPSISLIAPNEVPVSKCFTFPFRRFVILPLRFAAGGGVITLTGADFVSSSQASCIFDGTYTTGSTTVVSSTRVVCVAPPVAAAAQVAVQFSSNGGVSVAASQPIDYYGTHARFSVAYVSN